MLCSGEQADLCVCMCVCGLFPHFFPPTQAVLLAHDTHCSETTMSTISGEFSSDVRLLSFHTVCVALHLLLQTHVLCGSADMTAGASVQQEGELQGVSALGGSAFLRPVAVGDHQSAVLLRCGSFVEARRVATGVAGIVFMQIRQIARGDTATLDVRRLAVGVAVLLINVLTQLPPLPLFHHLRLHLGVTG